MLGFLIGLLVGGCVGIIATALMNVSSECDRQIEENGRKMKT